MKHKPKIIGIIIFNFAFLCSAGIALSCMNEVASYPDLQEPRIETWTDQDEPASGAQLFNSQHLKFQPPISVSKQSTISNLSN